MRYIAPLACARADRLRTDSQRPALTPASDDLEVPPQLPIGHRVLPLAPFPLARGGEVVDEVVAEPVARDLGVAEDARRLDERTRSARYVLGADVGAGDRLRGELLAALDAVQSRCQHRGDREIGVHVRARRACL